MPRTGVTETPGRARDASPTGGAPTPAQRARSAPHTAPPEPQDTAERALPTCGPALRGPRPRATAAANHPSRAVPQAPPGAAPRRPLFGSGSAASPTAPCPSPALPRPARAPRLPAATHPTARRTRPLRRLPGPSRSLTRREAAAPNPAQLGPPAPAIFRRCTPPSRAVTRGGGSARLRPRPAPQAAAAAGTGTALPRSPAGTAWLSRSAALGSPEGATALESHQQSAPGCFLIEKKENGSEQLVPDARRDWGERDWKAAPRKGTSPRALGTVLGTQYMEDIKTLVSV